MEVCDSNYYRYPNGNCDYSRSNRLHGCDVNKQSDEVCAPSDLFFKRLRKKQMDCLDISSKSPIFATIKTSIKP